MVDLFGKARKAVEKMYTGKMTVIEYQKVIQPNKTTAFEEVTVLTDQPCRLSFSSSPIASESDTASAITQQIKLFLAPEIVVKPGSKITVTQNGVTTDYKSSGVPAYYKSHQEIQLELFDKWS